MAYIEIKDLKKSFTNKKGEIIEVLKGIELNVEKGDIYGIIGYSGAGKSTLIRCINGLEKPDSGSVIIDERDITKLNEKQLMTLREKIGMIFQHFNLLNSKNVFENIALPLRYKKSPAKEIESRVDELLETEIRACFFATRQHQHLIRRQQIPYLICLALLIRNWDLR